jgi:hypothetical protein
MCAALTGGLGPDAMTETSAEMVTMAEDGGTGERDEVET